MSDEIPILTSEIQWLNWLVGEEEERAHLLFIYTNMLRKYYDYYLRDMHLIVYGTIMLEFLVL
jgi:hypothetical protein